MPSTRRKWAGLVVLSLALAIIIIDTTIINVSFRTIVEDIGTTIQSLQWVITGYALTLSALTITGGRLGDIFGRKRIFMLGAVVFAAGSLVAALAPDVRYLTLGASLIEGTGAALMIPATASLLLANFHGRERAIAFGVWGGVAGAAATIGPLLGGYLTTNFSWRYAYGINLVVVAILLGFSWLVNDPGREGKRPTVDFVGIFLSSVALASIVYGIVQSSTYGWFKVKEPSEFFGFAVNLGDYSIVPFALGFGFLMLIIFGLWQVIVEYRGKTPLVSPGLIANTRFTAGVSTLAIVAMGQFGMFFALPVFFQAARELDAFHTGLALLPFSLSVLFTAPLAGALGTKILSPKRIIQIGLIIDTAGIWYMHTLINASATASDLLPAMIVTGVGFGMAFSQLNNITLSSVSLRDAGEASGVNNTFRQLGATLGTAIIGAVVIASLTSHFNDNIYASTKIPDKLKPKIAAAAKDQVQSLGTSGGDSQAGLPGVIVSELKKIREDASAEAARDAFVYATVIVGFGVLLSIRLPNKIGEAPAEPKPAESGPPEPPASGPPRRPAHRPAAAGPSRRRVVQL